MSLPTNRKYTSCKDAKLCHVDIVYNTVSPAVIEGTSVQRLALLSANMLFGSNTTAVKTLNFSSIS